MANNHPTLRFDHREIAVIFSLFIFVSLLMFTVGILVGKGLAQAKYEAMLVNAATARNTVPESPAPHAAHSSSLGTSVTTPHRHADPSHHGAGTEHAAAAPIAKPALPAASDPHADHEKPPAHADTATKAEHPHPAVAHDKTPEQKTDDKGHAQTRSPLDLIPERPKPLAHRQNSLLEPPSEKETQGLMDNPKIRSLLEDPPASKNTKREVAVASKEKIPTRLPPSYPQGKYTVQVGSYPSEKDATDRVEQLKRFGFPFAYFSAKELGGQNETWYRVWLGYYPDYDSAHRSGQYLQEREEVRNYLVRKADATN